MNSQRIFQRQSNLLQEVFGNHSVALQWWDKPKVGNLGDQVSRLVVGHELGKQVEYVQSSARLIAIGSILGLADQKSVVWGSGFVSPNESPSSRRPPLVLACRGPKTGRRLEQLGVRQPNVFGDPGLLVPSLLAAWPDSVNGDVGTLANRDRVVLHVNHLAVAEKDGCVSECDGVIDFRVRSATNILDKLREIQFSRRVVSSGLHGIVLAHAFGVPAAWVEFSSTQYPNLNGGHFKFHDYFESVEIFGVSPAMVESPAHLRFDELEYTVPSRAQLDAVSEALRVAIMRGSEQAIRRSEG